MPPLTSFADLAGTPDPALDQLALALAAEFRDVDAAGALAELDALGGELSTLAGRTGDRPEALAGACRTLLGVTHGFTGNRREYDHPDNSMLDLVLARRRGLPILLSVVYVEVGRRAGIPLAGVGLPGHFVVGHFGADPPVLLDPFAGGEPVAPELAAGPVRPWASPDIAMRMLNNLVAAFRRRGDLTAAIRAARLRLVLPVRGSLGDALEAELRALQALLN